MYDHSTLAHAPDSHFLEYKYSDVDTGALKVENGIVVEDKNEIMFDLRIKDFEGDKGSLPTEELNGDGTRKLPGLHDLVEMEDSLNVRENETRDSSTSDIPLGEVKLSEETEFYTDKSVTECELPDIICLKEGAHHVVKDIWIDEGLPSFDNILIQNGELHHKGFACDTDVNSELTKEIVQTAVPISDGMNPFIESECEMDGANKCDSDHLPEKREVLDDARDEILAMVFDEKINLLEDKLLVEECTNSPHNEACNIDGDEANQDTCEEAVSVNSIASSAAEVSNCNQTIELPLNSEVENGSSTAYNFDSLPPTTSGREDPPNTDCKPPVQTFNMLCHEEDTLDSQAASSRSFFIQHGHGETSFSSVGPLSGPISYSGPIPYSGSISLRSDSSTTSTRSFAFPIMHTEWNSSPVKMAKADRRHFRKHRGWRMSLLCCRF